MTTRRLDAKGLRVLAHPLRVAMLSALRNDGPATASGLAERLGESSGTTSWHLRQLADAGFIEEDPERGTKRDRWWRARYGSTQLTVADFADRPELQGSLEVYLRSIVEQQFRRAADFLSGDWPLAWQDAATLSDLRVRTTPAGLKRLNAELFAVIERHAAEAEAAAGTEAGTEAGAEAGTEAGAGTGTESVIVQLQSFPTRGGPR